MAIKSYWKDFSLEPVPDDILKLVEEAVAQNQELKKLLTDRDAQIQKLTEQLNRVQSEDPQLIEQRLVERISKLKDDFRTMYQGQSDFIIQKIDLLKQKQHENFASLYKHWSQVFLFLLLLYMGTSTGNRQVDSATSFESIETFRVCRIFLIDHFGNKIFEIRLCFP